MDKDQTVEGELGNIAYQLKCLGTGNAATEMGAIEALAIEVRDGTHRIADALNAIADALGK